MDNLRQSGKSAELILQALQSVEGKQVQDPEPYVYRVIKDYMPKLEQSIEDKTGLDRPLKKWEQEWLDEVAQRRKRDKQDELN